MRVNLDGIHTNLRFSAAHMIIGHESCGKIHGHSYIVDVEIDGTSISQTNEETYTVDGGKAKDIIPMSTMIIFALTGLYLVGNWLMNTVYGFLI